MIGFGRSNQYVCAVTKRAAFTKFAAVVSVSTVVTPALALDCKKAASAAEKAICADAELRAEDERLNRAFADLEARKKRAEVALLIRDQREWLIERDTECRGAGDNAIASCLTEKMEQRRRFLGGEPETGEGVGVPLLPWFRRAEGVPEIQRGFEIASPRTAAEKALNGAISRLLANHLNTPKDVFSGRYVYGSSLFVSLQFQGSWEDGAHPVPWRAGLNFDMARARPFSFSDVFEPEAKEKLTADCRKQLGAEMQSSEAAIGRERLQRLGKLIGDLGRWSFAPDGATIGFDHGEINDYVEGDLECRIPASRVKELARSSFPLPK